VSSVTIATAGQTMLSSRNSSPLLLWLALLVCVGALFGSSSLARQNDSWEDDLKTTSAPGGRTFNSTCAGCHGLDGRGSDKGANIAASAKVRRLSDSQVSSIISNGIPGTGMPPFHTLSARQISLLVGYLRILEGKLDARTPPGDRTRGKEIFFGKGECSSCHMLSGEGGFLGPDLSAYGSSMSATAIRDEIVRPDRIEAAGYRSAAITTRDGDRMEGVIRNEDNFSLQLQTKDGSFHFFQKTELRSVEPLGHSVMPADYRQRLSPDELNDLVSYLMNGSLARQAQTSHKSQDPPQ
jgi:cytochrome c oxidase cbb3-type subunit 3